jgi:monoamine oxidase
MFTFRLNLQMLVTITTLISVQTPVSSIEKKGNGFVVAYIQGQKKC